MAFVQLLIQESIVLRTKITWYTSLLGKKASIGPLKSMLKAAGVCATRTTHVVQGKSHRWAIAWSFHEFSEEDDTIEQSRPKKKRRVDKKAAPLQQVFPM